MDWAVLHFIVFRDGTSNTTQLKRSIDHVITPNNHFIFLSLRSIEFAFGQYVCTDVWAAILYPSIRVYTIICEYSIHSKLYALVQAAPHICPTAATLLHR